MERLRARLAVNIYINVYIYMHMYIYIYVYIYMNIHIYVSFDTFVVHIWCTPRVCEVCYESLLQVSFDLYIRLF